MTADGGAFCVRFCLCFLFFFRVFVVVVVVVLLCCCCCCVVVVVVVGGVVVGGVVVGGVVVGGVVVGGVVVVLWLLWCCGVILCEPGRPSGFWVLGAVLLLFPSGFLCAFLCFLFFSGFLWVPFWLWMLGAVLLFFRSGFLSAFLFVFSLLFRVVVVLWCVLWCVLCVFTIVGGCLQDFWASPPLPLLAGPPVFKKSAKNQKRRNTLKKRAKIKIQEVLS